MKEHTKRDRYQPDANLFEEEDHFINSPATLAHKGM